MSVASREACRAQAAAISRTVSGVGMTPERIALLIEIVLPILMNMPCFKSRTPEQMQGMMTDRPQLMRMMAANVVRNRSNPRVSREESFLIADAILEHLASASSAEVEGFAAAVRGN